MPLKFKNWFPLCVNELIETAVQNWQPLFLTFNVHLRRRLSNEKF